MAVLTNKQSVAARVCSGQYTIDKAKVFPNRLSSSHIVDELPRYLVSLDSSGLSYQHRVLHVFLSYEDETKYHTPDTVVRALLRQLCFEDSIPEEIDSLYRGSELGVSTRSLTKTLWKILGRMRDTLDAPEASVESESNSGTAVLRSITVVFDAVDELPAEARNGLMSLMSGLSSFHHGDSKFALRIVLTTRWERYVANQCAGQTWYVASMPSSEVDKDIKTFITERLDGLCKMRQQGADRKKRIVEMISKRVQGMYVRIPTWIDSMACQC